jgi:dTDP-4-dehydrorhamnose 3,5-epimerase
MQLRSEEFVVDVASSLADAGFASSGARPANTQNVRAMNVIETAIPGVLMIEPKVIGDVRGFFVETFQAKRYAEAGVAQLFVQDNLSRSARRGARFAVDVRVGSPTFGQHLVVDLDDQKRRQLWLPRGFAHGFVARSDSADFRRTL